LLAEGGGVAGRRIVVIEDVVSTGGQVILLGIVTVAFTAILGSDRPLARLARALDARFALCLWRFTLVESLLPRRRMRSAAKRVVRADG
jgi:hypothetical protein